MTHPCILKRITRTLTATVAALAVTASALVLPTGTAHADPGGWKKHHPSTWHDRGDRSWKRSKRWHRVHGRHHQRSYGHHHSRPHGPSDLNGGHLIGGVLGAILGSQLGQGKGRIVGVIGGGLLGAVIGGAIGKSMDEADHARTQTVLESTPTARSVEWTNPDSGATYTVTPTKTYDGGNGTPCRDYTTWVFIDGYEEQAHGTACHAEDGTWQTRETQQADASSQPHRGTVDVVYAYPDGGR